MLMQLLRGFNIEGRLNVWKKCSDVLMKLMEGGELPEQILPILGGVSPAFLIKVNGNLDIEIDDYMKKKITENPLVEPILMDANTLVQSASNVHEEGDEAFEEHLKEQF